MIRLRAHLLTLRQFDLEAWMQRHSAWLIAAALLAISVCSVSMALAHSWYPTNCCSDRDCAPIERTRVKVSGADYVIDGKWRVPVNKATPSPDAQFHGCWPYRDQPPICFFAPTPSW